MLRNYFLIAWRNMLRNRVFSLINILGLATGVACCLLIAIYVWHEYSYDRFHPDLDQLYWVCQENAESPGYRWSNSAPIMGEMLIRDIPEVESMLRLHYKGGLVHTQDNQEEAFQVDEIAYVDSNFFQFLGFELLQGDPEQVLHEPNQVVITQSLARKLFDQEDAVGQILTVEDKYSYQVSGIMADVPDNSSLELSLLVSWNTLDMVYGNDITDSWWWPPTNVLVRLTPEADLASLNGGRLADFVQQYREADNHIFPHFRAFKDIRLYGFSEEGEGVAEYVSLFSIVALIILLIACINFMNLSTARSAGRAREVGVRKVVGANRSMLIQQFMGESFLITSISVFLGLGMAELLMPVFNQLANLSLSIPWGHPLLWLGVLSLALLVGVLSGSYPAVFLAQFRPVQVLKASLNLKVGGSRMRQGLVVSQFVIGITLIICTLMIWRQHQYMMKKSLGFDRELLLNISVKNNQDRYKLDVLEAQLEKIPFVERATPTSWAGYAQYMINFPVQVENQKQEMQDQEGINIIYTDYDWLQTVGGKIIQGRNFSEEFGTDQEQAFLVNRAMLKRLNDTSLLDRRARLYYTEYGKVLYEKKGKIVGVIEDFHTQNLRSEIAPMIVGLAKDFEQGFYFSNVAVRLSPGDHREQVKAIEMAWQESFPNRPFEYEFVEEAISEAYQQEAELGRILTAFTCLAIFIALLGLLGLAAFTAQLRTKEIGVRKILGASKQHILYLLNREFTWLVLLALLIALPFAAWLMQGWLEEYPYRAEFSVQPYVLAAAAALGLTWLTVSIHSLRAIYMNPADALRDE